MGKLLNTGYHRRPNGSLLAAREQPLSFSLETMRINLARMHGIIITHGENPHPVRQKKPNPWGLYDMHGNVFEWVEDDWHDNYEDAPNDGRAWIDKRRGANRVVRGGGWNFGARDCRSACRGLPPGFHAGIDFRLARSVALGP